MTENNSATWEEEYRDIFGEKHHEICEGKSCECHNEVVRYIKTNFYHKSEAIPREGVNFKLVKTVAEANAFFRTKNPDSVQCVDGSRAMIAESFLEADMFFKGTII